MRRSTSFERVCCPNVMLACHPDVIRPCVTSKGGDVIPLPTSFDRACRPRAVMSCQARRRSTVCAVLEAVMSCHA